MKNRMFTRIYFHIDDGYADKRGTGLAVEYDIFSKTLIWRMLDKRTMDAAQRPFKKPMTVGTSLGLCGIYYFLTKNGPEKTAMEWLGDGYIIIIIMLGLLCFLIIEYLLIRKRNSYIIIDPPSKKEQLAHLYEMYDAHIKYDKTNVWYKQKVRRKEDAVQKFKVPYMNSIFIFVVFTSLFIIFICLIQGSTTLGDFSLLVFCTVMFFVAILIYIWHIFIGGIVLHRIIKNIERQYNLESN